MSGGHPCLNLSAIEFAPAINLDTEVRALPAARMFTIFLREEQMEVGREILATSSRCSTRRPEGPAAVYYIVYSYVYMMSVLSI